MSHHESNARGRDARLVDRMVFFSDAVFAIVLTIMVLELHPPILPEGLSPVSADAAIWSAVVEKFRVWFAYIISFMLVSLWWTVHMRVTRALHHFDWPTAIFNLVFLFFVSLVPFAASVLGESINSGAAWVIYWGVNALASVALTVLFLVSSRNKGKLIGGIGGRERLARMIQCIGPGIGFAVGTSLAAIGEVSTARYCWAVIFPFMFLARLIYKAPKIEDPEA